MSDTPPPPSPEGPGATPGATHPHVRELRNKVRGRPENPPEPGPGQESVWEYPRPPRLEHDERRVVVELAGVTLADTDSAIRILETASPPTFYLPPEDVRTELLEPASGRTLCEWKGQARYWSARIDDRLFERVAWSYPDPWPPYEDIRDHVAFFAGRVDVARVGGVEVTPQPGDFYGGWITPEVLGPFKGEPGTGGW